MAMVQNLFNPVVLGNSSTLRQRDNIFRSLWHIEKWKIIGQWLRIFLFFADPDKDPAALLNADPDPDSAVLNAGRIQL